MGYHSLSQCLAALESRGELVRIPHEVDPNLEIGAIQRRVYRAQGPALLFTNVKGCNFPMAGNIFGTLQRTQFIFRDTLRALEGLVRLKVDPLELLKRPWKFAALPRALRNAIPKKVATGPILTKETNIFSLPQLKSWPKDGGGYVTLPQVYTESIENPGFRHSNLGMYRVQLSGGSYEPDKEVGLHYQIHRGIGFHHAEAIKAQVPLRVNVFIGGPPAMTLAAIMPLPEGIPEIFFAGVLAGHRIKMVAKPNALPVLAEADFCITGYIDPNRQLPEGPFGDHLGYYSLVHDFPALKVERVFHRKNAVWPFTTVGRPPQEDTVFGTFIHELTAALVPSVFAGVHEVNAVDASGVHPLLLAIGSERYVPYAEKREPQEIITCGLSLLGTSQTSLAKYVLICAKEDDPTLSTHNIPGFFNHILERADWTRDLHFITRTTMDTLDYSGISLNQGSKLVLAVAGPKQKELGKKLPADFSLPKTLGRPKVFAPGIVVIQGSPHGKGRDEHDPTLADLGDFLGKTNGLSEFPLVVVVDDAEFTVGSWENFLWVTFTRSDPATDIYGVGAFTHCKHWGCTGSLIIDARLKTYHAPPLEDDPEIEKRVDAMAASGGPLHGII
ncbi:MAG: UbiD family decarboxylase [Deltaproteobacteria bacterium]|nr:MAG: UbiD family decarboxylase [Deltaproteobacteria bacterium]